MTPANSVPVNMEAEAGLLASCFIDAPNVVPKCVESGITARDFYDPKHALVFEVLHDLYARSLPVDVATVAVELTERQQLDRAGGYQFLAQVSGSAPTTLHADLFAEKVRDGSLRRYLLSTAAWLGDRARDTAGTNVSGLIAELTERMALNSGFASRSLLVRLEAARYDPLRRLPDVEPVFRLGKVAICTRGNLSTITAQSKTGKSSFLAGMLAATFRDPDHGGDTFSVSGLNSTKQAVIHFDTEQHGKHHERMMDTVMKRAGALALPDWLNSYARKGASPHDLRNELEALLRAKDRQHGGIYAVFLDGIADFAADVNDPKETNPLVTWLESLAVRFACPIICVLHLNPTSGKDAVAKSRGHLGSQLQRKVETDIRLKKDADHITTVFTDPQGTRGEPVFEKDGPRFAWDASEEMHATVKGTGKEAKSEQKDAELRSLAVDAFEDAETLRRQQLVERVMKVEGLRSESTANTRVNEMVRLRIVRKFGYNYSRAV